MCFFQILKQRIMQHGKLFFLIMILAITIAISGTSISYAVYDVPNNDAGCPANCRQIPWSAGSDQWNGGTLPVYTPVPCTAGLVEGDGTTNNATAIQTCLNNLSSGQAAVLPAGIYYVNSHITFASNRVLRGAKTSGTPYLPTADATATTLKLGAGGMLRWGEMNPGNGSCSSCGFGTARVINSGYTKGSTVLTMAAGHGFAVGNWLSLSENGESDIPTTIVGASGSCTWCGFNNGSNLIQQFVQVTNVSGNDITISRPLYYAYKAGNSPTARTLTFPVQYAGAEYLRLNGSFADHDRFLSVYGCLFCWAKGVETYDAGSGAKAAHLGIAYSHGFEARDSYFHFGRDGSSDRNYGIALFHWNSDHKFENNILREHRHSFNFEGGGEGVVFLYNYVDDDWTDDLSFVGSPRSNHGAHPMMNLYEGNILSRFQADWVWGSSSHMVLFRNWIWGDETGNFTGYSGSQPDNSFIAIDWERIQHYYAAVGNILGGTVTVQNYPGHVTWSGGAVYPAGCGSSSPRSAPTAYRLGCNGTFDSAVRSTAILHGNYDYKTVGVAFWDGGADHTLRTSMYYNSKPAFFGNCTWPPFGPEGSPTINKIPARERYQGGTACGSSDSTPPLPPQNLRIQ